MALLPGGAYRRCSRSALLAAARSWSTPMVATCAETAAAGGAAAWVAAGPVVAGCAVPVSSFLPQAAKAQMTTRPVATRSALAPATDDRARKGLATNIGNSPGVRDGRTCA